MKSGVFRTLRQVQDFVLESPEIGSDIPSLNNNLRLNDQVSMCRLDVASSFCPKMTLVPPTPNLIELLEASSEHHDVSFLPMSTHFPVATSYGSDDGLSLAWTRTSAKSRSPSSTADRIQGQASDWSSSASVVATESPPSSLSTSSLQRSPNQSRRKIEVQPGFVKRPLNSFMLYRKDHQHEVPTNNHQSISRIIGDMWRKETAETKNYYDNRAKEERERHRVEHPGYKFQPKKKKDCKLAKRAFKDSTARPAATVQRSGASEPSRRATYSECTTNACTDALQPVAMQRSVKWRPDTYPSLGDAYDYSTAFRESPDGYPLCYTHYAGRIDCDANGGQFQDLGDPVISDERFRRDPQDWHFAQTAQPQTPPRESNHLQSSPETLRQHQFPNQGTQMPFGDWQSPLAGLAPQNPVQPGIYYPDQYLIPLESYQPENYPQTALDYTQPPEYDYGNATNYTPGFGAWEIEPEKL